MKEVKNIFSLLAKFRGRSAKDILKAGVKRLWKVFYLKRELILFGGDMTMETWFEQGGPSDEYNSLVDIEIRLGTVEDLCAFEEFMPKKKIRRFKDWFEKNYLVFVGIHKGRVVYYQWLILSDFYDPFSGLTLRPSCDEIIPMDLYTVPEFRFKNIHKVALREMTLYCKSIGRYKMKAICKAEQFPLFQILYRRMKFAEIYPLQTITYKKYFSFFKRHTIKYAASQNIR